MPDKIFLASNNMWERFFEEKCSSVDDYGEWTNEEFFDTTIGQIFQEATMGEVISAEINNRIATGIGAYDKLIREEKFDTKLRFQIVSLCATGLVLIGKLSSIIYEDSVFEEKYGRFPKDMEAFLRYIKASEGNVRKDRLKEIIKNINKDTKWLGKNRTSKTRYNFTYNERQHLKTLNKMTSELLAPDMLTDNKVEFKKRRIEDRIEELCEEIKKTIKTIYDDKKKDRNITESFVDDMIVPCGDGDCVYVNDETYTESYDFSNTLSSFFNESAKPKARKKGGIFSSLFNPHDKLYNRITYCKSYCLKPIIDRGSRERISWGWVKNTFKRSKRTTASGDENYTVVREREDDSRGVTCLKSLINYSAAILNRGNLKSKFTTQEREIIKKINSIGFDLLDDIEGVLDSDHMDETLLKHLYEDAVDLDEQCDKI